MNGSDGVDFSVWDGMTNEQAAVFLSADHAHPSRAVLAAEVLRFVAASLLPVVSIAEVGPGTGRDFARYYYAAYAAVRLDYVAYEGSTRFATRFAARFPGVRVIGGGFADLPKRGFDVVFSRAVLEHQPALLPALAQQIAAARHLCAVGFYLPPSETEEIRFSEEQRVNQNRYAHRDVETAFAVGGMRLDVLSGAWLNPSGAVEPYAVYVGRRD